MLSIETTADTQIRIRDSGRGVLQLTLTISEDDPLLTNRLIAGSLDWNDGSLPVSFATQVSPLSVIVSNPFLPGRYFITIRANNYRQPTPDIEIKELTLDVIGDTPPSPPTTAFIGPILPRDYGFPNAQQWNLDTSNDLRLLESSVKMLLITGIGERIMQPTYGTNIRRVIFETDQDIVNTIVQDEINKAVNRWEPRVQLQRLEIQRPNNGRKATVNAVFLSKLSGQVFNVSANFER
jgi:hypothetical protein